MDLSSLFAPISDTLPCGADPDVDQTLVAEWYHFIEEDVANQQSKWSGYLHQLAADPESRPQPPSWTGLQQSAFDIATKTKHLQAAAILAECLALTEGLSGLRDGIGLIARWCADFWGQLHPGGSAEILQVARANCIHHLKGPAVLARFERMPLAATYREQKGRKFLDDGPFGLGDYIAANNNMPSAEVAARVLATFAKADQSELRATLALVQEIRGGVETLGKIFDDHQCQLNLNELDEFLGRCVMALKAQVKEVLAAEAGSEESVFDEGAVSGGAAVAFTATGGILASRTAAIASLDKVIAYFESAEPSSPVPLMLRRAKRCVGKSFMEIVDELGQNRDHLVTILKPDGLPEGDS